MALVVVSDSIFLALVVNEMIKTWKVAFDSV